MDAMTTWIVLSAVVAAAGIGAGAVIWLADLRPRLGDARAELGRGLGRVDLALLSGGPVRAVDAQIVDFVERGLVATEGGVLRVSEEVDRMLDTPVEQLDSPPATLDEAMTLNVVRRHGGDGLEAVRRGIHSWQLRGRLARLGARGLVAGPQRRTWAPMIVAGPLLLGLFVCWLGLIFSAPLDEVEWPAAMSVMAWLPVTLGAAVLYSRRPGFHGRDPRTRLGRDVVTIVGETQPSGQADLVARGGFAAMTDAALRRDVQGDAVDACWSVRRRVGGASDANALLAAQSLDGGGDAGGDGGGGD